MSHEELPIRTGTPDDWDRVAEVLRSAFQGTDPDPDQHEMEREIFEPDRSLIVTDGEEMVGHASAYTREMSVPGAVLPTAHVTMVSVAPTHRRRGLLNRMMTRQLREVREAGREPIAALWASEGRIYPRYGYGLAGRRVNLAIDTREVRLTSAPAPAPGALRLARPDAVLVELAKVYDEARAERPGWSNREDRHWRLVLADPPAHRGGNTERKILLHDGPAGIDGYALWRGKTHWDKSGPNGEVIIQELVAANPEAYRAMWQFLLSVDLTRTTRWWAAALDEPVIYLVNEPRRLNGNIVDSLFVRVVDLAAALRARRYAAPVDVVLDVTDGLLPENAGRWRLVGDGGSATCTPTDAPADLACDITDLGAAYLGGTSLTSLAAGGRVRELRPGALPAVSTAFGWHRQPAAMEVF